jgi:ABC-type branched-subunit amino acid transport system permease subunit
MLDMGLTSVWAGIDLVFALRALVFSIEVLRGHSRRADFFQWTALVIYGYYMYYAEAWRYGFQGGDPWQTYLLESAFVIQALADVRYYFAKGHPRSERFQRLLWILNAFQLLYMALRPTLLVLVVLFLLLELWLNRKRPHHKHAEG